MYATVTINEEAYNACSQNKMIPCLGMAAASFFFCNLTPRVSYCKDTAESNKMTKCGIFKPYNLELNFVQKIQKMEPKNQQKINFLPFALQKKLHFYQLRSPPARMATALT